MKKKRAFTLIELMVVIAILALLVSMIWPAIQKARSAIKGHQSIELQPVQVDPNGSQEPNQ